MTKPAAFIDFDGVINSYAWWSRRGPRPSPSSIETDARWAFDPAAVQRLNRLYAFGVDFVVSSSWRLGSDRFGLTVLLQAAGFEGTVIGTTPDLSLPPGVGSRILYVQHGDRGDEIKAWLEEHGPRPYIVLDDDFWPSMAGMPMVQTDFDRGLLDHHIDQAIALLREQITTA